MTNPHAEPEKKPEAGDEVAESDGGSPGVQINESDIDEPESDTPTTETDVT